MQVTTHTGIWSRQPLATLGKLTAVALLGSALAFATLLLAAMRNEILRRRVRTLRLMQASAVS